MNPHLESILHILEHSGRRQYGAKAVTQLDHALQCAMLAELADASSELIAASLLHDLGHLMPSAHDESHLRGDRHAERAIPLLTPVFSKAVTEPVRLHVAAKRYLCAVNGAYWNTLSPASQHSLELQCGVFSLDAAALFIQQPYAAAAVQLRHWDDSAKVPQLATPDLLHFASIVHHVAS